MPKRRNGRGGHPGRSINGQNASRGSLIIIGGHEEKAGQALILREVARRVGKKKLVVATVASEEPGAMWRDYQKAFSALGVQRIEHLNISDREALLQDPQPEILDDASVVFFTGGGQLRITTLFGGTELCERVQEFYRQGGTVAGTSAGASVMSDTMLVSGHGDESHHIGSLQMAPGLGYIKDVIVDQHFAERAGSAGCSVRWRKTPGSSEWVWTRTPRWWWKRNSASGCWERARLTWWMGGASPPAISPPRMKNGRCPSSTSGSTS